MATLIVQGANDFRLAEGLPPLVFQSDLLTAADEFACFMAATDEFGHTVDGKQPWDRTAEAGYKAFLVSENIAYQFSALGVVSGDLADRFLESWKGSPPHCANLLNPAVTQTGVAVRYSARTGRYYAVQLFGRPSSQTIVLQIENRTGASLDYELGEQHFRLGPRFIQVHQQWQPTDVWFSSTGRDGEVQTAHRWVEKATSLVLERSDQGKLIVTAASGRER